VTVAQEKEEEGVCGGGGSYSQHTELNDGWVTHHRQQGALRPSTAIAKADRSIIFDGQQPSPAEDKAPANNTKLTSTLSEGCLLELGRPAQPPLGQTRCHWMLHAVAAPPPRQVVRCKQTYCWSTPGSAVLHEVMA